MKYALNLNEEGRILSVTFPKYAPADAVTVECIPEGNVSDYRCIDGEFVHDPLPKPQQPEKEPSADEILNVLLGVSE